MKTIMSDEPISEADGPTLMQLARAGWSEADLAWERLMEQAAALEEAGEHAEAAAGWAGALALAREHFTAADPRLAASLGNHAHGLRRTGQAALAAQLFDEALLVWDSCGPWLDGLRPERRARSSLFHLRLELASRETYEQNARRKARTLAAEGRAAILGLRQGSGVRAGGLACWRAERPATPCDPRKLLAAVLLIAPGPGPG